MGSFAEKISGRPAVPVGQNRKNPNSALPGQGLVSEPVVYKMPSGREVRSRYKWVVIAPDLFPGEEILCVMDKKYLEEAQKENPGLVTYLLSEMDALQRCKGDNDVISKIHMMKKAFGGWVTNAPDGLLSSV